MAGPVSPVLAAVPSQDPYGYGPVEWNGASPEEAAAVGMVCGRVVSFERTVGTDFRENCEKRFRQYRGFKQFRDHWVQSPNDRDALLYDAKRKWGAQLHIPLSFRTIETIVPRAIAQNPRMLYLPRDEQWRKNVETVRLLIDSQQQQISIELPFQEVMRTGRIYGLGASKTYWRREVKTRRRVERNRLVPGEWMLGGPQPRVTFDDPMFEAIDVFDFMWDPHGSDMRTCEWVVHRQWMSSAAVLKRIEEPGVWDTPSAQKIRSAEDLKALTAGVDKYSQVWQTRMLLSGLPSWNASQMGEHPHEVLEFHDGQSVLTVLDRRVLVQAKENPCGEFPFQVYQPTPLAKQMVGIGDLEPIEHLQAELDTLRSQRRDAATLALASPLAFDENAVEREDLTFGPEMAIGVRNATPKDAIYPLPAKEIPGSGYQEEAAIRADLDDVSGMVDARNNNPAGSEGTATEASLMQAALGRRIELGARRFEIQVVRAAAEQFLYLNQAMILENRPAMLQPGQAENQPEGYDGDEQSVSKWRHFPVGPGELEGDFEIQVEGGSMAARNIPQDRADARDIMQGLAHDWYINPTKARLRAMELLGIKHPQAWLRDPTPSVPLAALRMLVQAGVDPHLLVQSVIRAREVSAPQEGPSASQITEQMGMEGSQ